MISLISAIGRNNELGKGNDLLWKLPADMEHFKKITSLHTVLMGRKTFESIGHPLPNRRNIVITRDVNYRKEGIEIAHHLSEHWIWLETIKKKYLLSVVEICIHRRCRLPTNFISLT